MKQKKQIFLHFIIWLLLGLVCTVSLSAAHLTHAGLFADFYNVGKIQDFSTWNMIVNIPEEGYAGGLPIGENEKKWKYMILTVKDATAEKIDASFEFYKKGADKPYAVQEVSLSDGRNVIKIKKKKFGAIVMRISGQAGESFCLERFQLCKQEPIPDLTEKMGKRCLFFGALYILISSLAIFLYKRSRFRFNWDFPADFLQRVYVFFGKIFKTVSGKIPERGKSIVRCAIFLFLFIYTDLSTMGLGSVFGPTALQKTVLFSILLLGMAVLCLGSDIRKQDWHTPLVKAWTGLAVLMIISDIFVKKTRMFNGLVLLVVFGFLIFAWNTMSDRKRLIADFLKAVHIFFVAMTVFCFICRPAVTTRYLGIHINTVTFAMYTSFIGTIALAELFARTGQKNILPQKIFFVVEFLVSFYFTWKTQSRSGMLVLAFMVLLVMIWVLKGLVKKAYAVRAVLLPVCLAVILALPIFGGSEYLLTHLPQTLGTEIEFQNDQVSQLEREDTELVAVVASANDGILIVENSDSETGEQERPILSSRLIKSLTTGDLNAKSSGRSYIWKAYIREMNLFGHSGWMKFGTKKLHSHNALIQIPYQFGVFAVIPYIFLLALMLGYSGKYMFSNLSAGSEGYVLVPMAVTVTFLIFTLFDRAEFMYNTHLWISFYWIMGMFFRVRGKDIERKLL